MQKRLMLWALFYTMSANTLFANHFVNMTLQQLLKHKNIFQKNNGNNQLLKFLSYNIQLNGLDILQHYWHDRKQPVATLIKYADIIALQEITHKQLVGLKKLLLDYEFVGFNTVTGKDLQENSPDDQEGLVTCFRKDEFMLQKSNMQWYSDTPAIPSTLWGTWPSAFPKALQKTILTSKKNAKVITIYNSHFAHDQDPENIINPRVESSKQELDLLQQEPIGYWISAGDRNFHYPRDANAYQLYHNAPFVADSSLKCLRAGANTTFIGYEDHPRMNYLLPNNEFLVNYYLDVIFHNPVAMQNLVWINHLGEYDDQLKLLDFGGCKQKDKRQFASDHTAVFAVYLLKDFWE